MRFGGCAFYHLPRVFLYLLFGGLPISTLGRLASWFQEQHQLIQGHQSPQASHVFNYLNFASNNDSVKRDPVNSWDRNSLLRTLQKTMNSAVWVDPRNASFGFPVKQPKDIRTKPPQISRPIYKADVGVEMVNRVCARFRILASP